MPARTPKASFIGGMSSIGAFIEVVGPDILALVEEAYVAFQAKLARMPEAPKNSIDFAYVCGRHAAIDLVRKIERGIIREEHIITTRVVYRALVTAIAMLERELLATTEHLLTTNTKATKRLDVFKKWLAQEVNMAETTHERDARYSALYRARRDMVKSLSPAAIEWMESKMNVPVAKRHETFIRHKKTAPARAQAFDAILEWCFED